MFDVVEPAWEPDWSMEPEGNGAEERPRFAPSAVGVVGLEDLEPGPGLAAFLAALAGQPLSGRARVAVLRAHRRMVSHHQARMYAEMAAIVETFEEDEGIGDDVGLVMDAAAAEVRAALRMTRRAADRHIAFALDVTERLPMVGAALAAGVIDTARAHTMVDGTLHLDVDAARAVIESVIDDAPGLTTGQLGVRVRRLCIETAPDDAATRYRTAVEDRKVVVQASEDGTAHLYGLNLEPDRVAAIRCRINRIAKGLKTAGDDRSIDQVRADVFVDLLEGTTRHPADRGTVDIRVDLATLVGLAETPGDLGGYGPVVADIAKRAVTDHTDGQWRYTITHPDTGAIIDTGATRRRPTADQRRTVHTRDTTCIFPGCRMPATDCDLDHRVPWAQGGATTIDQLVPLCRHDHRIRHQTGWTHQPLPDGDHLWTSPLHNIYTTSGRPP